MELLVKKARSIKGVVNAPPSKSYTHRAFLIASLAVGTSRIRYPLYSEDTCATLESCKALGIKIEEGKNECVIQGTSGMFKTPEDVLNVKNSGTTLRMLSSAASLAPKSTILTGDSSLRSRPMQELIEALGKLGVKISSSRENGRAPIIINGGISGGKTSIPGDISSQFISSILITAPYAENPVDLEITGKFISKPYVDITIDIMEKFGVQVEYNGSNNFHIVPQKYKSTDYLVEGDYSSASYLIAAAAILDSDLTIRNLNLNSKQGDKLIMDIVNEMGCETLEDEDQIKIRGRGKLQGMEVDLQNTPDLLPTVAALGAMAEGTTHIYGAEHARYKETDRIHACAEELKNLSVSVIENEDGLTIKGGAKGGVVNSHNDHRMVMSMYLIGLKVGGVTIKNPWVFDVSFPNFTKIMENLIKIT